VTYRLVASVPGPRNVLEQLHSGRESGSEEDEDAVHFRGERRSCRFVWRESLGHGETVLGLAVIEEPTATTLVPPGWRAEVARTGALELERVEGA
jgi:N-methylhydantoinase A